MQSYGDFYCPTSYFLREDESNVRNSLPFNDIGVLENDNHLVFDQQVAVDDISGLYGLKSSNVTVPSSLHYGGVNVSNYMGAVVDTAAEKRVTVGDGGGQLENWGESVAMVDTNSLHTDSSTDTDDKFQNSNHLAQSRVLHNGATVIDSNDHSKGKTEDQKILRRLAQNREAARKSRLRKKIKSEISGLHPGEPVGLVEDPRLLAYVQQLENSRIKLAQLEQELERARRQGFIATGSDPGHSSGTNGVVAFDVHYACWLDEHQRLINDTRSAINSNVSDDDLRTLVENIMSHYDELYKIKCVGAKSDIFHMLSGLWNTPVERCFFMWLGGFRSSELLKILVNHLEPLTEQQLMGICNLQQSSQQAEDALSQGMEALQQSLVDTLSSNCLGPSGSGIVADYMGQMATAMGKLATLENFLHQADLLRQQTLHQMHRILTTRQAARAHLLIHDYTTRLRALSSLWLARPKN